MRLPSYVYVPRPWLLGLSILLGGGTLTAPLQAATLTVCGSGCAYSDLQRALDAAQPGDTVLLRAGETYVGNFVLPVKGGSGPEVIVRSDAPAGSLPGTGSRLVPFGYPGGNTDGSALARLVGAGGGYKTTPVLQAAAGAHHYRLQFLDIDGVAQEGWETLVEIGNNSWSQSTWESMPYSIVLDRVYIHGHPTKKQKRCVSLNGRGLEVLNSYVVACASFDVDSQAIAGFNGTGPFRIVNNFLEASGENVMFGGADPKIYGTVPSDIEIRRNHFSKPLAWRDPILAAPAGAPSASAVGGGSLGAGTHYFTVVAVMESASEIALSAESPERAVSVGGDGSAVRLTWSGVEGAERYRVYRSRSSGAQDRFMETPGASTSFTYTGADETWTAPPDQGTRWSVKNLLELKNAQRVTIDGNIFEQLWPASQQGYAILLTPRNEEGTAPYSVVRDVTLSNNIIRHVAGGIIILGDDDERGSERTGNITIRNNLVYDVSWDWGGSAHFLLITRAPYNVKADHNTVFHDGVVVLVDNGQSWGFEFTNNLAPHNDYGIYGSGAGIGTDGINAYFPDAVIRRNALGGGSAAMYPPDNFFPSMSTFTSQFVDVAGSDFRLASGSSFLGAGTDGRNLGVDFSELDAALPDGSSSGGSGGGSGNPGGTSTPFGGTALALPGTIQAENFDEGGSGVAYHDGSGGNNGGVYRTTDVDVADASDTGAGYTLGWTDSGEWTNYSVNVGSAGTYDIEARVASDGTGGAFHVEVNGTDVTGPIAIPDTGGWQSWTTVRRAGVGLSAGMQVWRLVMDSVGSTGATGNINYLRVTAAGGGGGGGGGGGVSSPYGGTPRSLPGTIQAEDFDSGGEGVAYHDDSSGNAGGEYRTGSVDIAAAADTGGGYTLGWAGAGEWLNYTVNVGSAGTYDIEIRVASAGAGGTFHIDVNGVDRTGPIDVPDTGGWQSWTTIRRTGVSLSAGQQIWRFVLDSNGATGAVGNVNYFRVTSTTGTAGGDIVLYASDVSAISGNWARVGSWSGAGGEKMQSNDWGWSSPDGALAAPPDYFEAQFVPEANRAYRVWLRLRGGDDSKWNDSVWVQFSGSVNSSGSPLWRINSGSALLVNLEPCGGCGVNGWGWQRGAWWLSDDGIVRFSSGSPQTLRVQIREDGVEIDQIVLSPITYFDTPPGGASGDGTIVAK